MKLLSISTDRSIFEEGSAVRARQIEYAKKYEEMHIVVFADRSFTETTLAPNCFVYPTSSFSKLFYIFDAIRLGRFIIKGRGITHITCQDASFTALVATNLKKRSGLPLEIQVHGDIGSPHFTYSLGNKIRKALALSYLPKADTIRVVSERIKKYLTDSLGISSSKIEVRPITVDTNAIKNAPIITGSDLHTKYPQFKKIALVASRFESEKNVALAIRAWKQISEKCPQVGLVILGRGSQESMLKSLVKDLNLEKFVVFEAWGTRENLFSYYKTADVFVNTSLFEGYGMTLVEAQAAGCPVVSTDVGIAEEVGATIVDWNEASVADGIMKVLGV